MKKRIIALLSTILMLLLFVTACSSGPSDTGSSSNSPENASDTENTSGEAEPGKDTVVLGVGSEFSQYVPLSSNITVANRDGMMVFALYDPLIWRDPLSGELQPAIAESWDVSEDGLEYTLLLRDDVTFHNGTPLTAEDVAWTLNLLPTAPAVSTQNYPGFNHAEAVDTYTVKIVMDQPFAAMLNGLAAYHVVCLSQEYFNEVGWDGYTEHPIGTGPYMFVDHVRSSSLTLEAYDGYWGENAKIKNLKILMLPDANSQILSLENGEIDVLYNSSIQNMVKLDNNEDLEWQWIEGVTTNVLTFGAVENNVMLDENLRKAILSAINYDGINESINMGYTQKASNFLAPGITARPEEGTFTAPIDQDVEKAKEYLAASDYEEGTPVRMICISGSKEEKILTIILGDLQAIGINAEVIPVDGSTFVATLMAGDFEISLYNTMPSLFDANLIYQMYDPASSNFEMSVNPDKEYLAELAVSTLSEMDPQVRSEIFGEIVSIVNEKAYSGFLYYDVMTIAYDKDLQNIQVLPSSNYRISEWSW